jgi:adenylate cyclase class 1
MMESIERLIAQTKKNFIFYNIARLREMIRYLPPNSLELFREIPFLIHINAPDFPGYVESLHRHPGLWNFQNAGFAQSLGENNARIRELLQSPCMHPAVQGLYHMGSLGTFTQSGKSDFDFWVIVDPKLFTPEEMQAFHEKLHRIVRHGKEQFSQEISFFVHTAQRLRNNLLDLKDEKTVKPPAVLLKEEFYRTFFMVAGKIPLWAVLPAGLDSDQKALFKERALLQESFIDLGCPGPLSHENILEGLLWQICKAPEDPVKALIKASITASYQLKNDLHPPLLCDQLRQDFALSRVDDYAMDPYVLAFERVLAFHQESGDSQAMSEVKMAIFLRLCGFPQVSLPQEGSPKRKILNHYVRKWHLDAARLQKLLHYSQWHEVEKQLLDQALMQRVHKLYTAALENTGERDTKKSPTPEQAPANEAHTILRHKAASILNHGQGERLPPASLHLRSLHHGHLDLKWHPDGTHPPQWQLFSDAPSCGDNPLFSDSHILRVLGWGMGHGIFRPNHSHLRLHPDVRFFGALEKEVDWKALFMALQPWMPISDAVFLARPFWERIVLLLSAHPRNPEDPRPFSAELLMRNSWGEIFFQALPLDHIDTLEARCYHVAMKVLDYHGKQSLYAPFLLGVRPLPQLMGRLKTLIEDKRLLRNGLSVTDRVRRTLLDTL